MDDIELLFRTEGTWQAAAPTPPAAESDLQKIIADQPGLIPHEGEALAVREFRTTAGPLDIVIVDAAGAITIVEVKRDANPEVRRKVVGQALDYAGRLWEMPLEAFQTEWARHDGAGDLADHLGETGLANLADALTQGRFRLVLAVDTLNETLTRIVDYLNQHTLDSLTVMAMEFRHWQRDGVEILLPRLHGEQAAIAKETRAQAARGQNDWTRESTEAWILGNRPEQHEDLVEILDALESLDRSTVFWTRSRTPSLVLEVPVADGQITYPLRLELGRGDHGIAEIHFRYMTKAGDAAREACLDALAAIPELGINAPTIRAAAYRKRPVISLDALRDPDVRNRTLDALVGLGA